MFCEPVRNSYAPAENVYKTPDKCMLLHVLFSVHVY